MEIGATCNIELTTEDAELFKEFCRQYQFYTLAAKQVLTVRNGSITLNVDKDGRIRNVVTQQAFLIT